MNESELIECLSSRVLNIKTNNYIFTNCFDFGVLDSIPDTSTISFKDYDYDIDTNIGINIKVDFNKVSVHNIFSYIFNYLKQLNIIDISIDFDTEFNNKLDIRKLQKILRSHNLFIQIICFNLESLDEDEQKLFNELYYFNSPFYCVISFVKENFRTYFLTQDRVLDYRENYTKIEVEKRRLDEIKLRKEREQIK